MGVAWLHSSCGTCEHCESGWETLCQKQQNSGYSVDGCLAEYTIAKASHAIHIPTSLSFEQAARMLIMNISILAQLMFAKSY